MIMGVGGGMRIVLALVTALIVGCITGEEDRGKYDGLYRTERSAGGWGYISIEGEKWEEYGKDSTGRVSPRKSIFHFRASGDTLYPVLDLLPNAAGTKYEPCTSSCEYGAYLFLGDSLKYVLRRNGDVVIAPQIWLRTSE
jgi:hypothetical protein